MERAGILVLLVLVAVFVAPSTNSQVLAADLEMMTIAVAETEEESEDYQDYREEAAGDIYSHPEHQEDADQQEEQEPPAQEEEELESDAYGGEPDY